jgi:predicted DNA-binding transcriptional regulator AlpA
VQNPKLDRFLRIPEICERLGGVHKSTIYRNLSHLIREVLPGVSGVFESEFLEYLNSRPLRKQKPAPAIQAPNRARNAKKAGGGNG